MNSNIAQLLESFKSALHGSETFKEDVCLVIKEKTTHVVETKCVTFKNQMVCITSDPYLKTEIFLHKEEIVETLRAKHPTKNIIDII